MLTDRKTEEEKEGGGAGKRWSRREEGGGGLIREGQERGGGGGGGGGERVGRRRIFSTRKGVSCKNLLFLNYKGACSSAFRVCLYNFHLINWLPLCRVDV